VSHQVIIQLIAATTTDTPSSGHSERSNLVRPMPLTAILLLEQELNAAGLFAVRL
jgi:hypothetical protein